MNLNLQIKKPDEVIIVDASESSETERILEKGRSQFFYPIHYYRYQKGLTRQRNFGIGKAKYEIIGFSDDDCLYVPDFMARIVAIFEKDEAREIGGASGFIFNVGASNILTIDKYLENNPNETEFSSFMKQFSNRSQDTWRSRYRKGLECVVFLQTGKGGTFCPIRCRFYGFTQPFAGTKAVDFLRGIAFYRREVFEQDRYSDFFTGYGFGEDVYFSLLLGRRWRLMVDGEAYSYHLQSPSARPNDFRIGIMSTTNYFHIFKTYRKRNVLEYVLFWYFFSLNTLLDLLPIFLLRDAGGLLRLFMGRCYGGLIVLRNSLKKGV
jgi:glycosyltransferase involved in cell wall biosynthesis